jgi:hypothetical protein
LLDRDGVAFSVLQACGQERPVFMTYVFRTAVAAAWSVMPYSPLQWQVRTSFPLSPRRLRAKTLGFLWAFFVRQKPNLPFAAMLAPPAFLGGDS